MSCCLEMADSSEGTMRSSSTDIDGERPTVISLDESQSKKTCADCGTSKTPLWRGGPAGPKSLCNACGIKSRKKRGPLMRIKEGNTEMKKMKRSKKREGRSRLWGLGREGLVKILMVDRRRRKMGEEEEAAVLLMALSHGLLYMLKS